MDVLPQVPAIAETLRGYEAVSWSGIGAPAHTPAPIIERINRQTNAALAAQQLKARLATFGAAAMTGTPAAFGTFIAGEIDKWAKVIKFAHIKSA
jgi:tripartite-type tricarboxylate transporter receptor subunit TctC